MARMTATVLIQLYVTIRIINTASSSSFLCVHCRCYGQEKVTLIKSVMFRRIGPNISETAQFVLYSYSVIVTICGQCLWERKINTQRQVSHRPRLIPVRENRNKGPLW